MEKTYEEMAREIMSDETLRIELMNALNDPAQVADFLKKHECGTNVSEFIAYLDKFN